MSTDGLPALDRGLNLPSHIWMHPRTSAAGLSIDGPVSAQRNVSLSGWLDVMDYTRTDIVLMIMSTISVVVFLGYVAFGPTN
jgi:hypothetical protein